MSTFPNPFFQRLRCTRARLEGAGLDAFVVTHPPNVRYLTGFAGSAGLFVLTAGGGTLVVDFRYAAAARAAPAAQPSGDGLRVLVTRHSYEETLVDLLRNLDARRIGIEAVWMSVSRFNHLSGALAGAAPTPLESARPCPVLVPTERFIEQARMVKGEDELAILRQAGRLLSGVTDEVVALARPGRAERDIASEVDGLLRRAGFERPAFDTIVASGPNSALPHARPGARMLQDGDSVVLDFGGVYDGYFVDLSRTVQLGGGSPELRRIFQAVAEAQAAAIAAVQPGVPASRVDAAARELLGHHGFAEAFGHATGHGLGLELHEEPRIGAVTPGRPDVTLEPGMVFTVEPGVYVEGVGGVRIEDDVVVTSSGCDVLTRDT